MAANIDVIAGRIRAQDASRSDSIRAVARDARELGDILTSPVAFTISDSEQDRTTQQFTFGQIVDRDELQTLHSQTNVTESYIGTATDSAVLAHIDQYGAFLSDWQRTALAPAVDKFRTATTGTTALSITAKIPIGISELIFQRSGHAIESIEREAEARLNQIERVTTQVGQQGLAKAFVEAGKKAEWSAVRWTIGVILCVAGGIGLPAWALAAESSILTQVAGGTEAIIKAALGLPLFALAAYCGHVASQQRQTARHMKILTAQLNSVAAYSNELPEDQRLELLMLLGKRTFSDPGLIQLDKGKLSYVPDDFAELTQKLIELRKKA